MVRTIDVAQLIDRQKINWFVIGVLIACTLVALADGYNITVIAFAAPAMVKAWALDRASLGFLLSASFFSGVVGPLFFGYLADRVGRRNCMLVTTLMFGVFGLASAFCGSLTPLVVVRFLAGIGMSGAVAVTVTLTNEFAPRRMRATFVTLVFSGTTIGSGLPGLVAASLMADYGWQILFWIGGGVTLIIAFGLLFILPESPKFLSLRPERRSELGALLSRLAPGFKLTPDMAFVIHEEGDSGRLSLRQLFVGRLAFLTPLLWFCAFDVMMMFQFLISWLPTLLTESGVTIVGASLAGTVFQFAGTLGGWCIMRPLDKYGMLPVTVLYVLSIPVIACLGLPGNSEETMLALCAAAGFCVLGLHFGQISGASNVYPTSIRAMGVGWFTLFARVGMAVGPLAAGVLLARHVAIKTLFYMATLPMAIGAVVSAIVTLLYLAHYQRAGEADDVPAGGLAIGDGKADMV